MQKNAVAPINQSVNSHQLTRQEKRNHNQMFILMITNVCIFLITNLPLILVEIISLHTVVTIEDISKSLAVITIISWFQQLNCSVSVFEI